MSIALRKQYRTLLEALEILVMPGVFDGFSTAIVERLGFKAGFVSGAASARAHWASPTWGSWASRIISREPGRWPISPQSHCRRMPIQATAMPSMSSYRARL